MTTFPTTPTTAIHAPADTAVAHYASTITSTWQKQVASIVATGKLLITAKSVLDHGQMQQVYDALPFSARTGQRLAKIAAHPVLSNATHVSHLPASWGTLAELAKIDPLTLTDYINTGVVTATMERAEAEDLVTRYNQHVKAIADGIVAQGDAFWKMVFGGDDPPEPDSTDVERTPLTAEEQDRLEEIESYLDAHLPDMLLMVAAADQGHYDLMIEAGRRVGGAA